MKKNITSNPIIMGIDEQELKIIKLIADGLANAEISKKMEVKSSVLNGIRKNLISKTRSKNIASLVSFAYKYGLLKV